MRKTSLFIFLLCLTICTQAQTTISGSVLDINGEALIGATVLIKDSFEGANTDVNGTFRFTTTQAAPIALRISYIGYITQEIPFSGTILKVVLEEDILFSEEVVISASRRSEKIQEAPASISIISERKLAVSPQIDAVRNLVNVPGVQIAQQSANRINISMREESSLFSTDVFPIMDYRSLVGPGFGTFQSDAQGLSTIDLRRIEVVRGPGSALYGPGVTSGVVHFITKDPIDYPGTTIEGYMGEKWTFGSALRHAGRTKDRKFGWKINAQSRRGNEFTLDPVEDSLQIAKLRNVIVQPQITNGVVDVTKEAEVLLTEDQVDRNLDGNPMSHSWFNTSVNTTFQYRPQSDLNMFASFGYNVASSVFYNSQGEGLAQSKELWTQARVTKGGFFGQFFYVDNDGGGRDMPSFLYQTGFRTSVRRKQIEGQLQYNLELPDFLSANITGGVDYRLALSDSENQVYGRNENDDDYQIIGGYAQGKFTLMKGLDIVLAGRFDTFNFLEESGFSPRAAVVYAPNNNHSFRLTYNRATAPPSALRVNTDLPLATPVPGLFDIWLAGQKNRHTFSDPSIDLTAPGLPNLPYGTPGLPLAIPFGAVNEQVLAGVVPALQNDPLTAPLAPAIEAFLRDPANIPAGFTGTFAGYNIFTGDPITELVPNDPMRLSIVNSFEAGYKGNFFEKLSVAVDVYNYGVKGFTVLNAIAPTIALVGSDIAGDLGQAVSTSLQAYLESLGVSEIGAAGIAASVGAGYAQGGAGFNNAVAPLFSIFGAVESDAVPQEDGITHVATGYRSFADAVRDHWGADVAVEYFLTPDLSFFANYSWLSQNAWIPGEANDDGLPFPSWLGVPQNKYRVGGYYTPEWGFNASFAFQHDDSFFANFGQFGGNTEVKNVLDASVGYTTEDGFSIMLSATNVLNNQYRAFPNFPKIGRRALLTMRYTFGTN